MKRFAFIPVVLVIGIAIAVAISLAGRTSQRLSIVADLPTALASELDMSRLAATPEAGEELSGGATTVRDTGIHAFGRGPMNLVKFETTWTLFREGRKLFERDWYVIDHGHILLGPHFNASSCSHCHKFDGRGRPPISDDEVPELMVMRLSIPHGTGTLPEPTYGEQLRYYSVDGSVPEGSFRIEHDQLAGHFADGSNYTLQLPSYEFQNLGYGSMAPDVQMSPRVPPATFGLGLLEAIPDRAILAQADPDDVDRDGISGRPNFVVDVRTGKLTLGRFGWKANQPNIAQQMLKALSADIGITSQEYPQCEPSTGSTLPTLGIEPELKASDADLLLYYLKLLAPPQRRRWADPDVLHGKALFQALGCTGCHHPAFTTGIVDGYPELSNQAIRPYTDLLLHDMGEGLADNRPDGCADGREWRTPPLWGIGLVKVVNGHTSFLHDGRARNIEEAILWHGGEAAAAQIQYRRLRKPDRTSLLVFLESL